MSPSPPLAPRVAAALTDLTAAPVEPGRLVVHQQASPEGLTPLVPQPGACPPAQPGSAVVHHHYVIC